MKNRYEDLNKNKLKLSFIAPSGYGKTTAVEFLHCIYGAANFKVAAPLYDFQGYFYKILQVDVSDRQDGELLQFLGNKIQRDYPFFLADAFYKKLEDACNNELYILTNDDCRPHNYPFLKQMGFLFVRIFGNTHFREDITPVNQRNTVEWGDVIPCDYVIENNGSLQEYKNNLRKLVSRIAKERDMEEVLCYSNRAGM